MNTPASTERSRGALALRVALLLSAAAALKWMGRRLWCKCGEWSLASGAVQSMHNSQHLVDPYTLTHVSHGLGFYALLRCAPIPRPWRLTLALALESVWEVFENTPLVIDRYRSATVSLDYFGDSIANSLADVGACLIGYAIAARWPWRVSLALFLLMELILLVTIRDSLSLNVVMLVWPLEALRRWQTGG